MSWFQQTVITLTDFNCFPCFVHKTVPVSFHHCLRFSDRMIGINQLSRDCVNNVITKQKDRKMFYRNRFVNVSVRQHTIFLCLWQMLILWWGCLDEATYHSHHVSLIMRKMESFSLLKLTLKHRNTTSNQYGLISRQSSLQNNLIMIPGEYVYKKTAL